jgi:hypothetical protein
MTKLYDPAANGRDESGNDQLLILCGGTAGKLDEGFHITAETKFDQSGFPIWAGWRNSHAGWRIFQGECSLAGNASHSGNRIRLLKGLG